MALLTFKAFCFSVKGGCNTSIAAPSSLDLEYDPSLNFFPRFERSWSSGSGALSKPVSPLLFHMDLVCLCLGRISPTSLAIGGKSIDRRRRELVLRRPAVGRTSSEGTFSPMSRWSLAMRARVCWRCRLDSSSVVRGEKTGDARDKDSDESMD